MRHPGDDDRREQHVAHAERQDGAEGGTHVAVGREQGRPVQERRDEDQEDQLGVEPNRRQSRKEGDEQPAGDEQGRRGNGQPPRHQREKRDANQQRENGLEVVHDYVTPNVAPGSAVPRQCAD